MSVQLVSVNNDYIKQLNAGNNEMVVCSTEDLIENSGICALVDDQQVAIFYLPKTEKKVFAVSNWDPLGKANVISRGIVGDLKGTLVVASPLYKQHYSLESGICLEDSSAKLATYEIKIEGDQVIIA